MKEKNNKRKITISLVVTMILIAIVVGVSFSFYKASTINVNKTETAILTKKLGLVIDYEPFSCSNIVPGDECTKTFSVRNTSSTAVTYNIYLKDTVNGLSSELDDFVYTLKQNNNVVISEKVVPDSNATEQYIKVSINIAQGATHNYEMKFKLKYLNNEDQSHSEKKEFVTVIGVDTKPVNGPVQCTEYCPDEGEVFPYDPSVNPPFTPPVAARTTQITTDESAKIVGLTPPDPSTSTPGSYSYIVVPTGDKIDGDQHKSSAKLQVGEGISECESRLNTERVYGTEVVIYHDIYYADQNKYANGLNERYVTYCTPWKEGTKVGIRYCPATNLGGNCRDVTNRTSCTYDAAMDDHKKMNLKEQTFSNYFADRDNGNWHIQTYCENSGDITDYKSGAYKGIYYCNKDAAILHDWYASDSTSANTISNELLCEDYTNIICKRAAKSTLHTETCNSTNGDTYCNGDGYAYGDTITYGNRNITEGELNTGDVFDCDVNGDGDYDPQTERFYYVTTPTNGVTSNTSTAALIYYTNTINGLSSTKGVPWYSSGNYTISNGPVTAKDNLPTTTQWSKVSLLNTTRDITDKDNNVVVSDFSYASHAARLLTYQEVNQGCYDGKTDVDYPGGLSKKCQFLFENSQYQFGDSNNNIEYAGINYKEPWLETPGEYAGAAAFFVYSFHRELGLEPYLTVVAYGARPVIEVPISKIIY